MSFTMTRRAFVGPDKNKKAPSTFDSKKTRRLQVVPAILNTEYRHI